jgi:hypothetical protein
MAGVMVMLAATFVVLSVWDSVSRLRSIETRESIEKFLSDAPGSGLGVSVESMIQMLHGISIVAALSSVAAIALGWQVLQRSRQARLALSVLAVPIFVTGLVAGGFMSSLVVVATAMLWLSPSREWFAGLPIPEPVKPVKPGRAVRDANTQAPSGQGAERAPMPTAPPTAPLSTETSPTGWPVTAAAPKKRPDLVTVALVLTVVVAGIVFLMTLVSLVLIASQPDLVLEELHRQNPELDEQGVSETLLLTTSYVSGGLALVWSGLAIVLAVLMAGRRAWAARGLLICAAACALFCVIATLATPVALIPAVAAIATVSCLRRPEVRAWLEAPR